MKEFYEEIQNLINPDNSKEINESDTQMNKDISMSLTSEIIDLN